MIWFKFKCHHRNPSFLCQSLFSFKCSEAECWGTTVTDSVGWHFAECLSKTSLWVWLHFPSNLICSPLVLKSCRKKDSRPTWISTVLVPMLNLEPSFSLINHRLRRENCSCTLSVEEGGWGKLPVGFYSRGEESPPWCRAGAVWGVPVQAASLRLARPAIVCPCCTHFNIVHQVLIGVTT